MKRIAYLSIGLLLSGCATQLRDIGREPHMTPVGSGLAVNTEPLPVSTFAPAPGPRAGSLWNDSRNDLFRDQRASRRGDLLTVNISMNDRASFGNTTDRSRESKVTNTLDYAASLFGWKPKLNSDLEVESNSSSKGQGVIDRSEKIQISVAAVVVDVLPNGNLLISGSQEIRVNYELRLLEIAGVVRPRDISRDNTISYDKIAEARIAYGGRGRMMEVQQPALVHQIYDLVTPF